MNYYAARQRSDGSGWAFTYANDGIVRTYSSCLTWPEGEPTSVDDKKPLGDPHAHATAEEAERCFYAYELAHLRELRTTSARRCRGPHAEGEAPWTDRALEGRLLMDIVYLCDEHRTADVYEQIQPFRPGIQISASW